MARTSGAVDCLHADTLATRSTCVTLNTIRRRKRNTIVLFLILEVFQSNEQPRTLWWTMTDKVRWRFSSLTLCWMGPKGVVSTTALSTTIAMKVDEGQIVVEIYWSKRKNYLSDDTHFWCRKNKLGYVFERVCRSQTIVSLFGHRLWSGIFVLISAFSGCIFTKMPMWSPSGVHYVPIHCIGHHQLGC